MSGSPAFSSDFVFAGRYRVVRRLGSGSVGTVYLVDDEQRGELVSLKLIRPEVFSDEGLERLRDEFRVIADLRHPQIAAAYDFGYTEGERRLPFYTRSFVDGLPLEPGPAMGEGGEALSAEALLRPIFDLLEALDYLHAHEISPIDLHPGNVIQARDANRGTVLIDFGLRPGGGDLRSTALLSSRSPRGADFLRVEAQGPAADIARVGRLLLYRLTGRSDGDVRLPRDIPGWPARVPLDLERVIAKAMAANPDRRFGGAREFRRALAHAVGSREIERPAGEPGEITLGREAELERVEVALREVSEGHARAFWITGPRGVGKSRLLTEARRRAQWRGLDVAGVEFLPGGSSESLERQLRRAFRGRGKEAVAWLKPLAREHGGSPPERAARAVATYFAGDSFPLVVLVDNLDEADAESRATVEALALACSERRESARGLFVAAVSSEAASFASARAGSGCELLALGGLVRGVAITLLERFLRPLRVVRGQLRAWAADVDGTPLRLRQLARFVLEEYARDGRVPEDPLARIPWSERRVDEPGVLEGETGVVIETMSLLCAPMRVAEIAGAAGLKTRTASRVLRDLRENEVVSSSPEGRSQLYYLAEHELGERVRRAMPEIRAAEFHRRARDYFGRLPAANLRQRTLLVRLRLATGQQARGREAALSLVSELVGAGRAQTAIALLEAALASESALRRRFELAEEISELRAEEGDHLEGIAALEPLGAEVLRKLPRSDRVRFLRRLGAHFHRAGKPDEAVRLFGDALAISSPAVDRSETVRIECELSELHTLRGDYDEADAACRRGLAALDEIRRGGSADVDGAEVTLRATLGHLELRRMRLAEARDHLSAALRLAEREGIRGPQALILNNLGIVFNQLDRYARARHYFRRSARLISTSGERRSLVQIACNIALIAAKTGDATEARDEIRRARRLLREQSGERLEFFVDFAAGLVEHFLGEETTAIECFERALPIGRELSDEYMVRFGSVYLAEAKMISGRFDDALRILARRQPNSPRPGFELVRRMELARRAALERWLGSPEKASAFAAEAEALPTNPVGFLEGCDRLWLAVAATEFAPAREHLRRAERCLRDLRCPAFDRWLRVAKLYVALWAGDRGEVRELQLALHRAPAIDHRALSVLSPLGESEASAFLGDIDRAQRLVEEAAGAIVGRSFLEIDCRIEEQLAVLADRRGEREAARHHVHRARQTREIIVASLPARRRELYLAQERFSRLERVSEKVERWSARSTTPPRRTGGAELVVRSRQMEDLVASALRLAAVDQPVLIVGETGVGKDLLARVLHDRGPRAAEPFEVIACGALPEELFEAELFGHAAGAFTGAEASRSGILEHASGGTLLVDGITDLPFAHQAQLLRVLDRQTVRPLGSLDDRPIDVRFLFTSRALPRAGDEAGALREDLLFRIGALTLEIPPLRDRPEDIPPIFEHLLARHARKLGRRVPVVESAAFALLSGQPWRGNVRELEGLALRVLVERSIAERITAEDLAELLTPSEDGGVDPDVPRSLLAGRNIAAVRRIVDRAYLRDRFRAHAGDLGAMRAELGVKKSRLYAWLREVGLDVRTLRGEMTRRDRR